MLPRLAFLQLLSFLIYCISPFLSLAQSNNGPGGLYSTETSSNLVCWVDIPRQTTENNTPLNSMVSRALDYSYTANHFEMGTGALLKLGGTHNLPSLEFNGTTNYLEARYNAAQSSSEQTIFVVHVPNSRVANQAIFSFLDESGSRRRGFALRKTNSLEFWTGDGGLLPGSYVGQGIPIGSGNSLAVSSAILMSSFQIFMRDLFVYANNSGAYVPAQTGVLRLGADNRKITPNEFFSGSIAEVIVFNKSLPLVEQIIISNYLSAKYNTTSRYNLYRWDEPANGNFDFDVAGIGNMGADTWRNSLGTGMVRIQSENALVNRFLFWGHNNASMDVVITDLPTGIQGKLGRTWGVNSVTSTGTPANLGLVTITFDLTKFKSNIVTSDLRLLIDHDGDRIYNEPGTIIVSDATNTGNLYQFSATFPSGATTFTLGTINIVQTPLPVVLKDFQLDSEGNKVNVSWTTLTETNSGWFEVERAQDAKTWTKVGVVPAAGNSTKPNHYFLSDPNPPVGRLYYRLRQMDIQGGSIHYAPAIIDYYPKIDAPYPNPAKPGSVIQLPIIEGAQSWDLFSINGTRLNVHGSDNLLELPSTLTPGLYILKNSIDPNQTFKLKVGN